MEIKEQLVYIVDNIQFTDKDDAIKFVAKYENGEVEVDDDGTFKIKSEFSE